MNSRTCEVQPLWMEVPQVATFSNIVDLLKEMFQTPHACYELKFLKYRAITIDFVNFFPKKFNGDILFELLFVRHPLGQSRQS